MTELGTPAPAALLEAEVLDAEGRATALRSLFEPHPVLLLFLRHYGCVGCSRQVEELTPRVFELVELGVRTIYIGSGNPAQMQDFAARHGLADKAVTLVTDPALTSYRGAGMHRSLWSALEPRALWFQARALAAGFRARLRLEGDLGQQGGALLLDRHARIVFARHGRYSADNVDGSDLVAAALALRVKTDSARGAYVL